MNVSAMCNSYFNGLHELSNCKEQDASTTAIAALKVFSYLTFVIPAIVALILAASSLCGRVTADPELSETDKKAAELAKKNLGSLSDEQLNTIYANVTGFIQEHTEITKPTKFKNVINAVVNTSAFRDDPDGFMARRKQQPEPKNEAMRAREPLIIEFLQTQLDLLRATV